MSVIVVAWSSRLRKRLDDASRRGDAALDVGDLRGHVLRRLRQLDARSEILQGADHRPELVGWHAQNQSCGSGGGGLPGAFRVGDSAARGCRDLLSLCDGVVDVADANRQIGDVDESSLGRDDGRRAIRRCTNLRPRGSCGAAPLTASSGLVLPPAPKSLSLIRPRYYRPRGFDLAATIAIRPTPPVRMKSPSSLPFP